MDLYVWMSVLSVMHTCILRTVLSAPAAQTTASSTSTSSPSTAAVGAATHGRRVRNKRCSCATFMDKECVYFCHLDIIWVNTPERIVSYGLGNAPRTKRAAAAAAAAAAVERVAPAQRNKDAPRCQCLRENDQTCQSFCGAEPNDRYETPSPDPLNHRAAAAAAAAATQGHDCAEPPCQHTPSETNSNRKAEAELLRAATRTLWLLQTWTTRRRHQRVRRAWPGESPAP